MWFKYGLKVHKRVCHKSTARKSVRRSCGFAIRRQKRFDHFKADLQSAAVGFSYLQIRDAAFSLEADCKSAGTPNGLAYLPNA